jgi:hypothetical protein
VFLFAKGQQFHVNKLRSVVRVDSQQRKRKEKLGSLEGSDNCLLASMEKWEAFRPTGSDIGQGQGAEKRTKPRQSSVDLPNF